MSLTKALRRCSTGLGLAAGAVLQPAAAQQPTPVPRDTVVSIPIPPQPDTIVRRDSTSRSTPPAARRVRADSIQPALARAELPGLVDAARAPLVWGRDSILATGAITLADLLDRVPGFTSFRTGWLGPVAVGSYLGDVQRVRVFLDGIELDPTEARGGRAPDLGRLPLWALEELRIERTAGEVRVHARSWQVDRTTPYSRADVATGDQDTDLFRFFFGRRFGNGLAVQSAVEQYSTTPDRVSGTNSAVSLLGRVGWARGRWQADAFVLRQTPRRGRLLSTDLVDSIPSVDLTRTETYLRGGFGDVDRPFWVQAIVGGSGFRYGGVRDPRVDSVLVDVDSASGDTVRTTISADTSRFEQQLILTAGMRRGPLTVSGTHRMRTAGGSSFQTPAVRVSASWRRLQAIATAEGRGVDSTSRVDASFRVSPLAFLRLGGAVSRRSDARAGGLTSDDWRAEGALRAADVWLGGGMMGRGAAVAPPASVFGDRLVQTGAPASVGAFVTAQGRLWGPIQVDLLGEQWRDSSLAYRPQYQTRADVFVRTNALRRFPTGNFGVHALLRHEYRSAVHFPSFRASTLELPRSSGHRIFSGLLEIRILDATVSYQFRNLLGARFATVPGFQMPRQSQFYGVRWTFWN